MNDQQNSQHEPGHTPPPAAPSPTTASRRGAGTVIAIVTAVVGGLAILVAGGTAAFGAISQVNRASGEQRVDVSGVDSLDLIADASHVTVRFDDVDEAVLTVRNGRGDWRLERDDDDLVVRGPDRMLGWWFGGWFGEEEKVSLTLPRALEGAGLAADLELAAGTLDVEGAYSQLDVSLSAGSFDMDGSAETFDFDMSAGNADVILDGVTELDIDMSAGDADVELIGTAPRATTIGLSAGSLRLTLPNADYAVAQDVSAGSAEVRVDQSSSAPRTIDLSVSAGSISIRPGD